MMERHKILSGNIPVSTTMDEYIETLLGVSRKALFPSYYCLNGLFITYLPTFEDKKSGSDMFIFTKLFYTLVYLVVMLLTLPLTLVFYPVRIILLSMRKPFQYSVENTAMRDDLREAYKKGRGLREISFGIATANILVLPEGLSRYNNIKNVQHRAHEIGERIVIDQFFPRNHLSSVSREKKDWLGCDSGHENEENIEGNIRTHFSSLDFVCIQEAFSYYDTKTLMEELHKVYPYIIHDVGVHSFRINRFVINSGLMLASRYPITAAEFKPFSDFVWPAMILSQGVLMAKVMIGSEGPDTAETQSQRVGYIFNAHLQAYEGDSAIIPKQLDEILSWGEEFILKTKEPTDQVLFNVLCGDFNCDNISPGDRQSFNHEFFKVYKDFARLVPGKDKEWTVGTELRQKNMLDPLVSTPKGLKEALKDPCLRCTHVQDANVEKTSIETLVLQNPPTDEHGNVIPSAVGGKRRIDLILFHSKYPVNTKSYDFVTRLASLTDHIPVQTSFSCSPSHDPD